MARIVAFSNQKGGVGKTTSCVNMSANLAELGYKVLIVDVDPQGNASTGVGIEKTSSTKTIYDVICEQCDITEAVQLTKIKGLEIVPATHDLAGAEIELVRTGSGREKILSNLLNKIRASYDFICIDCPPSLGLLTVNALAASDAIIIPIQCEFFALEGISQLINTVRLIRKNGLNPNLDIDGVVFTMVPSRSILTEQVANEVLKFFGKKVFRTRIPRNIRLAEAPSHGMPITLYDRKCAGALAYSELTREYISRI
jgi:chromosome partitioning protein